MSHMGGTLRRLRLESGLSLRDLARRLGVSSAYLSRVEHGLDASPTPERLEAFATELGVPSSWLLEVGHRVAPILDRYVDQEPQAAALFAAIARRRLGAEELLEVQRYVERRFPETAGAIGDTHRLSGALAVERVILGARCAELEDAYELACARLATTDELPDAGALAALARERAAEIDPHLGGGVAVVSIAVARARPRAAVVVLSRGIASGALDGQPVVVVVVLVGPARSHEMLLRIAHVSRLASRGLVAALAGERSAADAVGSIAKLERIE